MNCGDDGDPEQVPEPEWTGWLPGIDYTATVREAKVGERALWRVFARLKHTGTRARSQALSTIDGEPVVRAELHPQGWCEIEQLVSDGERYRAEKQRAAE